MNRTQHLNQTPQTMNLTGRTMQSAGRASGGGADWSGEIGSPAAPNGQWMAPAAPNGQWMAPAAPNGPWMAPAASNGQWMAPAAPNGQWMAPAAPNGQCPSMSAPAAPPMPTPSVPSQGMNERNTVNGMTESAETAEAMVGGSSLNMQNNLPPDVVLAPTNMKEAYMGSLKAMLNRNVGNYIVATFLVGVQSMVSWEGILYDVGNDYLTIYQPNRDRYIVSDIYSLKFMEFYDTEHRETCERLLQERQGEWNQAAR